MLIATLLVPANVLEDARVHLLADFGVLEVLAFEDPVEVVQLVLNLLGGQAIGKCNLVFDPSADPHEQIWSPSKLEVAHRRDLNLADDLELRVAVLDLELHVEHADRVLGARSALKY